MQMTEIFGTYLLEQLLSSGEGADVWLASPRNNTSRKLILKRILPSWSSKSKVREIFFEIVKDFALLRHEHIVPMIDFGERDNYLYVVFEKVDGIFLRQLLRLSEPLEEKQIVIIIAGILSALSFLHQSKNQFTGKTLYHSEVSPINVLVDSEGRPKIVDMGFSRLVFEAGLPGKPSIPDKRYIAPELNENHVTNEKSDVFGIGMIIDDLLGILGSPRVDILEELKDRATSEESKRYQNATFFLDDLHPLLEKHSISRSDIIFENYPAWSASINKKLSRKVSGESGVIEQLSDRYDIISELGKGAMGVVFHGRDRTLDEELAIKVLETARHGTESHHFDLERFHRELKLARKVNHPNVARVYHLEELKDLVFYTMEFIPGEGLDRKINTYFLNEKEAVSIFLQLANGLDAIHQCGVVHRDIKPANILIQDNGRAVIADFGVAKREDDDLHLTHDGTAIGTPLYMAPEQMSGKHVDHRSDLYALGVVMYEVLTGTRPHNGNTSVTLFMQKQKEEHQSPRKLNSKISRKLDKIITTLLHAKPDKRYDSARMLISKLEGL